MNGTGAGSGVVLGLRRPRFQIDFGAAAGAGSPSGQTPGSWSERTLSIWSHSTLAPDLDLMELECATGASAPGVSIGDSGTLALGYDDVALEPVMSMEVESIGRSLAGAAVLRGVGAGGRLARLRVNQSYERQTAGAIVSDLAKQAGVAADRIDDGMLLPFYVVDDLRNAYQHVAALARAAGFLCYLTADGKLAFAKPRLVEPVQRFRFASDILRARITGVTALDGCTVTGEGSAGANGDDAWCWLIQDVSSVTAQAGGAGGPRVRDPSLRSRDAAQSSAEGRLAAAALRSFEVRLVVPGAPSVRVGSTVEIADAPVAELNDRYLVLGVLHRFSKRDGFTSVLEIARDGSHAAGGTPGGAP